MLACIALPVWILAWQVLYGDRGEVCHILSLSKIWLTKNRVKCFTKLAFRWQYCTE